MTTAKKTPTPKKAPAKKAAPKKASKPKVEAKKVADTSLAQTTGEALETLLKGHAPLVAIAKTLADGKATHAQLVTLRDGINEVAAADRGEGRTDEAKALSNVNRLVRRLERAAR